jgi:hypothetical protein
MDLRIVTRALLGAAALLTLASVGLVVLADQRPRGTDPASCPAQHAPGDLWVRWVEGDERAGFTPAVRLGKEAHRLERRKPDETSPAAEIRSHLVASRDGLWPCFCGRGEQLWKQSALPGFDALHPGGRWVLAMDEFFPAPAPIEIALDPTGEAAPREVALPAAGALRVKLWPLTGPAAFDAHAELVVRALDAPHQPGEELRFRLAPGETRRLPDILVGQRFELELRALRGELLERFEIDGPRHAGEEREVELAFGENAPLLFAELRNEEGERLFGAEVRALWIGDDGVNCLRTLRTRSSGLACFSLDLPNGASRRGRLLFEGADARQRAVIITELPESGLCDLGTSKLQPLEPRVAGRVVDTAGHGVPHAEVLLTPLWLASDQTQAETQVRPQRLRCDPHGWFTWQFASEREVASAYAVLARDELRSSRLHCMLAGPGIEKLVLQPAGSLAGRLLLPAGFADTTAVRLEIPSGEGLAHSWSTTVAPDKNGAFLFENLAPGIYSLRVLFEAPLPWIRDVPVPQIEHLVVARGERCVDPRLRELDVRAPFTEFVFELRSGAHPVDPKGCQLEVRSAQQPLAWSTLHTAKVRGGSLVATLPSGRYDFRFRHSDYLSRIATDLAWGMVIDLGFPSDVPPNMAIEDVRTYRQDLFAYVSVQHGHAYKFGARKIEQSLRAHWRGYDLPPEVFERRGEGHFRLRLPGAGEVRVSWTLPKEKRLPERVVSTVLHVADTRALQDFRIDTSTR